MSEGNPEELLKLLEEQAAEDEMRDVAKMSDAELDAELRNAGIDPEQVAAGARRRTIRAPAVWAAVLAAASLGGLFAWKGAELEALWKREPSRHDSPNEQVSPEMTLAAKGAKLRAEAFASCGRREWLACLDKLDAAREIDPKGDQDARVRISRETAIDAMRVEADPESKPKRR
jgi:hypothetical protein